MHQASLECTYHGYEAVSYPLDIEESWEFEMTESALTARNTHLFKSGINFVCSDCGKLLYHVGIDNTSPSPWQQDIARKLHSCPQCGRKLNTEIDPDEITIRRSP